MPPKRPPSAPRPGKDPSISEEALARERDVKFKQWLQNKSIKEKAFEVSFVMELNKVRSFSFPFLFLVYDKAKSRSCHKGGVYN